MPDTRRYNVVPTLALAVAATAALGTAVANAAGLGERYALQATAVLAVFVLAVARVAGTQHPHTQYGPPNVVTSIRAVLTALLAGAIGDPGAERLLWPVIGVVAVVAALDGVDGWLARRTRLTSAFGARFDMEADAALILVLSVLVWQHEKAGVWVLLCGVMRYLFVAGRWLWPWLARPLRSTWRGKAVAVVQYAGLGFALAPIVPPTLSAVVAATTLAALAWSFATDVLWLSRQGSS